MKKAILIPLLFISLISCTNDGDSSSSHILSNNSSDIVSVEISSEEEKNPPISISSEEEVLSSEMILESSELESITSTKYSVGNDDVSGIIFDDTIIH